MQKTIYLIQVGFLQNNETSFPLAAGCIMAYAKALKQITDYYSFEDIIFLREPVDTVVGNLKEPAVVGFSNYVWNFEYNKALAKKIKEAYPDCTIVFGGHHVPPGSFLLDTLPYVDFLIHGEGEEVFSMLLRALKGDFPFSQVPNISYRLNGVTTSTPERYMDGTDYPSPYLTGCFDGLISAYGNIIRNVYIETTRGCPFDCAYCDWGCCEKHFKIFSLDRVKAEIDWAAAYGANLFGICDSNFGILPRDLEIAEYIADKHRLSGAFSSFQTSYYKDDAPRVMQIAGIFSDIGINKGISLSVQSLDETVLKNIGRENISAKNLEDLIIQYNRKKIKTYSELILALPGETRQSFVAGVDTLLKLGQHGCLYIHNCELLPCSPMADEQYMKKFGIHAEKILLNQPHRDMAKYAEICEYSYIVTSTATLSCNDWVYLNLFSAVIQCFHYGGILKLAAIYLYHRHNVGYSEFYGRLLDYMLENIQNFPAIAHLQEHFNSIKDCKFDLTFFDEEFGSYTFLPDEYLLLSIVRENDKIYQSVYMFLLSFCQTDEYISVLSFQRKMLNRPGLSPFSFTCDYDFANWFSFVLENNTDTILKKQEVRYSVDAKNYSLTDYAKYVVWYGKRNTDRTLLTDITKEELILPD